MNGTCTAWLEGLSVRGIVPGLEPTRILLGSLGDPQKGLRTVHVAGSDGKGSVCCMIESVLRAAGLRTGMFTSPQILDINECIRIDGEPIDKDVLEGYLEDVRRAYDDSGCGCTNFEALTACALYSFAKEKVDVAVIEVGMGGRLDSTNLVEPEVTVINNISLEHTRFLGDTIDKIAEEKAGIMKPGVPCVTINTGDVLKILERHAEEVGCPLIEVDPSEVDVISNSCDGIEMRYRSRNYDIGLPGRFQGRNAAVAVEAISQMNGHEHILPFASIGLHTARWPARMEKVDDRLVVDVTHTLAGAKCLRPDIEEIYGKVVLVTAMLSDKDLEGVAAELSPIATKVLVSAPDSPRAADPESLADAYRKHHNDVTVYPTVGDAVEAALEEEGTVLVTGSFRTAEDCLRWLRRTR